MSAGDDGVAAALDRERRLWRAYASRDRDAIEALLLPEALDVGPAGVLDRDGVVAAVHRMEIASFEIEGVTVRSADTVEVVTYRSTVEGTYGGAPFPARTVWCTTVWVLRGDEWRVLHRHESPARVPNAGSSADVEIGP